MSYNNRGYSGGQRAAHVAGGRYNVTGQFVPAGELNNASTPMRATRSTAAALNNYQYSVGGQTRQTPVQQQAVPPIPSQPPQQPQYEQPLQQSYPAPEPEEEEVAPKAEQMELDGADTTEATPTKPSWMKGKGVKKVSNKERRRRQNEHLRRLLTPKNALMVLNEMMPGEQINNSFTVEAAPANSAFFQRQTGQNFCAGLALDGSVYKGFGENKMTARNAAAEQAIRDLVIKRMAKVLARGDTGAQAHANSDGDGVSEAEAVGAAAVGAGAAAGGEEEETLPMIQLASYALHKLFSEWQYEGFQVPLLNRLPSDAVDQLMSAPRASGPTPALPKPGKKPKELPAGAADMHPSVLLTQMRPGHQYNELAVEGDKPQNTVFTISVTVGSEIFLGKGTSKKIAKRLAARNACAALLGIQYADQ